MLACVIKGSEFFLINEENSQEEYATEQLNNVIVLQGLIAGCWLQKGEELKIAD